MKDADKRIASEIFYSALKAVDPYSSVKLYADRILSVYHSNNFKRVFVIGFGKAVCPMAEAVENSLPDLIDAGVVITKYGYKISHKSKARSQESKIKIYEAGHPIPNENGLKGTEEIIKLLCDGCSDYDDRMRK